MSVVIALGGNAMTGPDRRARPEDQIAAVAAAAEPIAGLAARGGDVLVTHGNGPQVGNLLVKNELAAQVVPPVPLDWCVAQTQGSLGLLLVGALERALAARGSDRSVAALVTRTLVDADDPAFQCPRKPVGRYLPESEAKVLADHGQTWREFGERGWRRVVASPEPRAVLDVAAVVALLASGFVVVAGGGGGIPVVRGADGRIRGVEAVVDKDLGAAMLAAAVGARTLVIATDVPGVLLDFGSADARLLGAVSAGELRRHADDGQFGAGSMGPKVEAACRFVEAGGERAVITSLERIEDGVEGRAGTTVTSALGGDRRA